MNNYFLVQPFVNHLSMNTYFLKLRQLPLFLFFIALNAPPVLAQYKEFRLSDRGDTLNAIDQSNKKQGKWINNIPELRGEPGYEEEGKYVNNEKSGTWRKYNLNGDLIAIENYKNGGKHGSQDYFNFLGRLLKHEEWKGYDPDAPYDTIPIYGMGNNEVIEYKIIKANQYSVPHGEWKYYGEGGMVINVEKYDRGHLVKDPPPSKDSENTSAATTPAKPKEKVKTKEMLEYEKKYSKKKRSHMEREGKTSL